MYYVYIKLEACLSTHIKETIQEGYAHHHASPKSVLWIQNVCIHIDFNNPLAFDENSKENFLDKMDIFTWNDVIFNNSSIGINFESYLIVFRKNQSEAQVAKIQEM